MSERLIVSLSYCSLSVCCHFKNNVNDSSRYSGCFLSAGYRDMYLYTSRVNASVSHTNPAGKVSRALFTDGNTEDQRKRYLHQTRNS